MNFLSNMYLILKCRKLLTTLFGIVIIFTPSVKTENQILDKCITITGQSKGMPCHFPFSYNGDMKTRCTNLDSSFYWCSTEQEYHTKNYGECSQSCPREEEILNDKVTTALSTFDTTSTCSDKWKKCISFSIPKFGCNDSEVQEGCKKSCNLCEQASTGQSNTCPATSDSHYEQCQTISGSGARQNTPCVFPFKYQEKTYCECTKADDTRYWCATAKPFSWSEYGYCNDYCPIEGGRPKNAVPGYDILFDQSNQTCGEYYIISEEKFKTLETCSNLCADNATCLYFFYGNGNDCLLYQSCIEEQNGSSLGSTYVKEGCKTVSGSHSNAPCVFPFKSQGKWHHACTDLGANYENKYWCATKEDDWSLKNYYGDCSSKCPIDTKCKTTETYSLKNLSCVFPFTYNGVIHYGCIQDGLSKHWCPTQLQSGSQKYALYGEDFINDGRYGYCNSDCPKKESVSHSMTNVRNKTGCSCTDLVDYGGTGKCQTPCHRSGWLCCYVNQPTNCKEVRPSYYHFGEVSEEPCREGNDEYRKYKDIKKAYCFPHITEHPNMLKAILECSRNPSCGMFFEKLIEDPYQYQYDLHERLIYRENRYIRKYFTCSKGAQVNLRAGQPTTLYVLNEDFSEVLKQSIIIPNIAQKPSNEDSIRTKTKGAYVSFFTFVVLLIILMFRAVIRAMRKISTYLKSFRSIFNLFCIIFAGYMTMIECLRYFENKDTSSFSYKKFGETQQDQYPTFSICLQSSHNNFFEYFDPELNNMTGRSTVTYAAYENILRGATFYQHGVLKALQEMSLKNFSNLDLEKIAFQLKDFVGQIEFQDRNSHPTEYYDVYEAASSPNATLPFHVGYKDSETICFTRNPDSRAGIERRFDTISLELQKLIATQLFIAVLIHHPGQLTRSLDKPILRSTASELTQGRKVVFNINQVSILRRRPDAIQKCDEGLHDDDRVFRNKVMQIVGCVPTYWMDLSEDNNPLKECKTASEMVQIHNILQEYKKAIFDSYKQPCDYMTIITSILQKNPELGIYLVLEFVYMDDFYQEIVNVRDFGFESFWSGVGGFVGIFLGYSLLQTPDLVHGFWVSTRSTRLKVVEMF